MISKVRFEAIACAFVLVPSDSDEQSRLRSALTLIFKLLAPISFVAYSKDIILFLEEWCAYFLLFVHASPRTFFCF